MLLMGLPFKRVAADTPASYKGHRYMLTLVNYPTRYSETVPLKNIDTKTVKEALLDLCSRAGIPEKVLSDLGIGLHAASVKFAVDQEIKTLFLSSNLQ